MSLRSTILKAIAIIALAITPVLATPPEGKIEINYHRNDGIYTKWGVHLWKSPNMPLMPTGTNEFGVYWHADLSEFNTGSKAQVNYIIHKGDIKEQGAKDMAFDGNAHKAIWVVNNDRTIYFSLEDAMKSESYKK
jgi:hypothetical protein